MESNRLKDKAGAKNEKGKFMTPGKIGNKFLSNNLKNALEDIRKLDKKINKNRRFE